LHTPSDPARRPPRIAFVLHPLGGKRIEIREPATFIPEGRFRLPVP